MTEIFKENLEKFIFDLLQNVKDESIIQKVQTGYDALMDDFLKKNFVPQEQIDQIIEESLQGYEKEAKSLKESNQRISKENYQLKEEKSVLISTNQGLTQKVEILEKSL